MRVPIHGRAPAILPAILLALGLLLLVPAHVGATAGHGPAAAPAAPAAAPSDTPRPTDTPTPTSTATPTSTPSATATPTSTPSPTPSPTPKILPALVLSVNHGITGTALGVEGDRFRAGDEVRLHWDQRAEVLSAATADGGGHIYLSVRIPDNATSGPNEIRAENGTQQTAYALVQVDRAATNTVDDGLCVDLFNNRVCIPTPGSIMYGLANNVASFWGEAFTAVTAPFTAQLISSPDITNTNDKKMNGIQKMQTDLSQICGALLLFFMTIGVLSAWLSLFGRSGFAELLAPIGRAMLVTGIIAGYQPLMATAFGLLNKLGAAINSLDVGAKHDTFTALGSALGTIHDFASPEAVVKGFVIFVALVVCILAVIIRATALGFLDLLFVIGPLCLVTWLSPQFEFLARWWWKTFFGLALYPIGYALVLKVISNLLASDSSFFGSGGNDLQALGLVLMIYRVPAMIGSAVGAGSAVFGSAASAVTDAGIAAGISFATRGAGDKIFKSAAKAPIGK